MSDPFLHKPRVEGATQDGEIYVQEKLEAELTANGAAEWVGS